MNIESRQRMISSYEEAVQAWDGKAYFSLDSFLKNKYGKKIYKLSLDGGMTCPNRDGTCGVGGCIFCSEGGSGDFASRNTISIDQQIQEAKDRIKEKIPKASDKYIAYFQSYTNTYNSVDKLRTLFYEVIMREDIIALSVGTRPDCLPEDVIKLLGELNQIKPVWVELGLQTIHEESARWMNRGYGLDMFESAVRDLRKINIDVIVHIILGLPVESENMMIETIKYLRQQDIQGVKLQLLHVLKDSRLGDEFCDVPFEVLTLDEYVDLLIKCLENLPQNVVIHRITGDGNKKNLLAPLWSKNKKMVLNTITKELKYRKSFQGKNYKIL